MVLHTENFLLFSSIGCMIGAIFAWYGRVFFRVFNKLPSLPIFRFCPQHLFLFVCGDLSDKGTPAGWATSIQRIPAQESWRAREANIHDIGGIGSACCWDGLMWFCFLVFTICRGCYNLVAVWLWSWKWCYYVFVSCRHFSLSIVFLCAICVHSEAVWPIIVSRFRRYFLFRDCVVLLLLIEGFNL